jgi:hypothetical protein
LANIDDELIVLATLKGEIIGEVVGQRRTRIQFIAYYGQSRFNVQRYDVCIVHY